MTTTQLLTLEEFLALDWPVSGSLELVRGEVVFVPSAGTPHNWIVGTIYRLLFAFADARQLGAVFGDGEGWVLHHDPPTYREPDVSFIADERIPAEGFPKGVWPFAPDLAVEVASPGDRRGEVEAKVQDYLTAGTRLVWVVWPEAQTVVVHPLDGEARALTTADTLDGGDVLPGFTVSVATLFAPYRSR